ncbi:hypothetical protein [Phenylobacterium sp.]|nr:hypothetical protein [Phenylobacterium sp.]
MSAPANFEGARPVIDPADAVLLLIESYAKAQDVATNHELLDSQRG